jgi:hypothetical protein
MGHVLVSSPRVSSRVVESGRDLNLPCHVAEHKMKLTRRWSRRRGGVAWWLNHRDDGVERLLFCGSLGAMSLSSPKCLVIMGEEVGITGVWMTGVEHCGLESTRRKVISVESEGINDTDQSRHGRRYAASSAVSNVEDC